MQTANFITASAEVTSITKLKKGDVYKRLADEGYGEDKIVHGIVIEVLYNGEDAAIQAMEFEKSYSSLKTEFKVFSGKKEIKIFPSSQAEVEAYLDDCIEALDENVENKEKELRDAKETLVKAQRIVNGDLIKHLTAPEYNDGSVTKKLAKETK